MFGASIFKSLSTRPPTPPRDTQSDDIEQGIDRAIDFLSNNSSQHLTTISSGNTPDLSDTPEPILTSSIDRLNNINTIRVTSNPTRKVNFAPFIQWDYHNSPVHPSTVQTLPVKPLAPSRSRFSNKSILKPFKMTPAPMTSEVRPYDTLQTMLEETVDALRDGDVVARASAYGSCLHTLQDFDSFPDTQSLADHSNQLLQYIRRDMETEVSADPIHSKLTITAIKLLIALIRLPESAAWFDADKMADALEFSVSMIQSAAAPKTILTHHLFFLSQQKFGPRIMTPDRVSRTITALTTIHERIPGNGVRAHRLLIYRRFVDQSPTVMRARAGDWIVNLYTSILSQKRDVREQGIELGQTTALRFGNHTEISRMVQELLDKEFDNKSFGKYAIERLQDLLKQKDVCVPRIWAITVLFLRGRNKRENHWNWFKPWLELASACVNSTDKQIKIETTVAWRKLIFACMPDMQTIKAVRNLLKAPIEALFKKEQDFTKGLGKYAMSTYFCLLQYSLRPGIPYEQLDSYWDEYVSHVLIKFASKGGNKVYYACSILQTMLKPRGLLAATPFTTTETQFEFDEPPCLEPRWIRSRLDKVLALVSILLMDRASWEPIDDEHFDNAEQSPNHVDSIGLTTWTALMDAVRDAGLMEVTTSLELKAAIAAVVNMLHQLAQTFRQVDVASFNAGQAFASLVQVIMERLGASHFAERMLMKSTDAFEVAPTPSHRPTNAGPLMSPLTHIFVLQVSVQSGKEDQIAHVERIKSTITLCWNALKSRHARLEMLGDLSEALEAFKDENEGVSDLQRDVADLLLELAEDTVLSNNAHLVSQPAMTFGDISGMLRILTRLMSFVTASRIPRVLYAHLVKAARTISGDGGVLLLVTEPQSSTINGWMTRDLGAAATMLITYATMIVDNDTRPRLGSMERARKQIWGGLSGNVDKLHDADLVHTNIWNLFDSTLRFGYAHLGDSPDVAVAFTDFLDAMQRHIGRSLRSFHTLVKFTQNALAVILLDEHRKLKDIAKTVEGPKLLQSILSLWTCITDKYRSDFKVASPASNWLETVQDLMFAGLTSPRESVVNVTTSFWNDFVDRADDLMLHVDWPDKLVDAAVCLRSIGDVRMPPGYMNQENEIDVDKRIFVTFSDYGSQPSASPLAVRKYGAPNHQPLLSPLPNRKLLETRRSPATRLTPRRKLRHEDSQIVFEPIATSSPLGAANETQNLTDHQKEVLERQHDDVAAMFPDIRSEDNEQSNYQLVVNSDMAVPSNDTGKDDDQDQSRLSTPDAGGQSEEELQSSPIAASQRRRANRSSSSNPASSGVPDVPSSPPSAVKQGKHVDLLAVSEPKDIVVGVEQESAPSLARTQQAREAAPSLPDVIAETKSDHEIDVEEQLPTKEHMMEEPEEAEDHDDVYRILSDDLPSSQLVAEMLASQSSPIPSVETEVEPTRSSQTSAPDEEPRSHSTASLLRGQTTLDDLFPSSFASSTSGLDEESQGSQYFTRSKKVKQSDAPVENGFLKRKRGPPKKVIDTTSTSMSIEPEYVDDSTSRAPRTNQSSSRFSSPAAADASIEAVDGEAEQHDDTAPSSKRRKTEIGAISSTPSMANIENVDIYGDIVPDAEQIFETSDKPMTSKTILARLQSLIADAESLIWSSEDQAEVADMAFQLQAVARGFTKL